MACANCGADNRQGRKFCIACGTPLAATCPSCGLPVEPEARFCGECGTALATGAAAASAPGAGLGRPTGRLVPPGVPSPAGGRSEGQPSAVAERRLVSVLFADLVGFTPFSEERDAEEVRETLSRYFELARDAIERHGGIVEKFIGDAVMAMWGAPTAHEDDAERAVRAAFELVDAVQSIGPGITARAGLLTGEAAVTLGAVGQGMVAGDIVNTAARLQSVALPGTVLVGEGTYRATSASIAYEAVGEQTLKGKSAPVPAWRALRVIAERGGRGRGDTLEAPFVGRDAELRLLKDMFHATARENRTRLVSILGPAGIGKSRLAWEFEKYLDGIVDEVWWHHGRSPAYGQGISFWALGEMIRGRAGLAETDDEATTRAHIAATVAEHVADEQERRWIEPALLALLGYGGGVASDELFAAWRTFFERLSATGTVVLVFEDLQWADAGLVDFIDHLLDWTRNLPIYIVTLSRPDLLDARPEWGAGRRNFLSISLEPLTEASMRELLAGLIPGLPEPAVRAIVVRADGVPLYAVETVRMLVAEGRLREAEGVYVPVGDLTTLAVPETLTALIGARLDALDHVDRTLLQDASVLGQSFTPAGLAAIAGLEQAELEPRLRSLVRRELLVLEADPRRPERGQYAFVQALIREVAYNTLSKKDRKERHLAAARWFESLGSDELAGALAGQYLAAYANSAEGAEADALAVQARIALVAAANRAAALGSHLQAVAFLEQALKVTSDAADQADLLERAGASASSGGRHDDADAFLTRALEIRRALPDRDAAALTTALLARVLLNGYRTERAVTLLEAASGAYRDIASQPGVVELDGQLARALYLDGRGERALEVVDDVLPRAERANAIAIIADGLVTRGTILPNFGRAYEGIAVMRGGRDLARAHGLHQTEWRALNNLGVFLDAVDPREAIECFTAALEIARRFGWGAAEAGMVGGSVETGIRTGTGFARLPELEAYLAQELDRSDRLSILVPVVKLKAILGHDDVDARAAELEALSPRDSGDTLRASVDDALGFVALARGDLRAAYEQWTTVFELTSQWPNIHALSAHAATWDRDLPRVREAWERLDASPHGPALDAARVTIRAGLAAFDGRTAESLALYGEAIRGWKDLGLPWDQALAGIDVAATLGSGGEAANRMVADAREILAGFGASPLLERLDDALEQAKEPV